MIMDLFVKDVTSYVELALPMPTLATLVLTILEILALIVPVKTLSLSQE